MFAAVYLDGGIAAASELIHRCLLEAEREEVVEERRRDYKTALQELVQRQADQVLAYRMAGEAGPDHAKTFQAEVLLNGKILGEGSGHSKKEAEQAAAQSGLEGPVFFTHLTLPARFPGASSWCCLSRLRERE